MSNAFIQVTDLSDPTGKTTLDMAADNQGQFTIPRLTPGHTYKLIARVKDGTRLLAGATQAIPPNPRINIRVSEEFVDKDTPPIPAPIGVPTRPPEPVEREKETKPSPAAGLGTPRPTTDDPAPVSPGTPTVPPVVVPRNPTDRTNVAEEERGGFRRGRLDAPPVSVPGVPETGDKIPPPPVIPAPREEEKPQPKPEGNPKPVSDAVPNTPTPVPSCLFVAKRLENFALFDLEGKPWEFRKDHKGRLVLLHFWSSTSPECLAGLKDLRDVQVKYDAFGLQVVSIAYEQGSWEEQVRNVRSARNRYSLFKFVTLLGGSTEGGCPVRNKCNVDQLPTLILLGEDGSIVWRNNGSPNADRLADLRLVIRKSLRISEP